MSIENIHFFKTLITPNLYWLIGSMKYMYFFLLFLSNKYFSKWIVLVHEFYLQNICFIFSLIFLLLVIQMAGVTAMATSQARPGPMKLNSSKSVVRKLMRNTIMLNRQSVMKPVVRETNST